MRSIFESPFRLAECTVSYMKKTPADKLFEAMRPEVRELERKARANIRHKKRADWWAKNGAKRDE